jgi:hypothetical protein
VTEQEWLGEPGIEAMRVFLEEKISDRKWLLYAAANLREHFGLLRDPRSRAVADFLEQWADGKVGDQERDRVYREAARVVWYDTDPPYPDPGLTPFYEMGEFGAILEVMAYEVVAPDLSAFRRASATEFLADPQARCALRDLIGNPFRPIEFAPLWSAAHDRAGTRLAEQIYAEKAFERLPILADALEEGGCADRAILDHCRSSGPHVLGCWVVDGVLGRC